jgi:hypothetical protein
MTVHRGSPALDCIRTTRPPRSPSPRAIRDPPLSGVIRAIPCRRGLSPCEGDFVLKCSSPYDSNDGKVGFGFRCRRFSEEHDDFTRADSNASDPLEEFVKKFREQRACAANAAA